MIGVLAACCLPLVVFALLDRRLPNDHDLHYTVGIPEAAWAIANADGPIEHLAPIARRVTEGIHPQLGHAVLLLWLAVFGVSRLSFALANLPFVLGLAIGTWQTARRLVSHRAALALTWGLATLPFLLCYARKREPFFHIAALAPLGFWAALVVLEDVRQGRSRRGPWLAFIAVELARIYAHHIALADAAVTAAVLMGLALRSAGDHRAQVRRRVGEASALAVVGASWSIGLWDLAGSGPSWSLPRYWDWRGQYLTGTVGRSGPEAVGLILRETWRWHLMPGAVAALFLPGALLMRRWWVRAPAARTAIVLLGGPALIQLPLLLWVVQRGGAPVDWGMLALGPGLLCGAAIWAVLPHERRGLWLGLIVAVGLWTAVTPLVLGVVGQDPVLDRAAFRTGPVALFATIDTGRDAAHHIPSRAEGPLARLVTATHAAWPSVEELGFDGHELWLEELDGCRWEDEVRVGASISNDWPALFDGVREVNWVPDGRRATQAAVGVLFMEGVADHQPEFYGPSPTLDAAEAGIGAARLQFADTVGAPVEDVLIVDDPGQTLRTMEWYTPSNYLRTALVWVRPPPDS